MLNMCDNRRLPEIGTPALYPSASVARTGGVITVALTCTLSNVKSQHSSVRVLAGHLRKSYGKPKRGFLFCELKT